MVVPLILAALGLALLVYSSRRGYRLGPAARLLWDLLIVLVKAVALACYLIAPQQIRPTVRARILPRPEIPRRTIFRRMLRIR
jgi:hypothetical protein